MNSHISYVQTAFLATDTLVLLSAILNYIHLGVNSNINYLTLCSDSVAGYTWEPPYFYAF